MPGYDSNSHSGSYDGLRSRPRPADKTDMNLTKASLALAVTALLVVSIAPMASAQGLPDPTDVGSVTDTVGNTTDSVTDTVGNTTDKVTDKVGNTTDAVTDTVDNTTGTVGNTTDKVTDTVDNTTGGSTGPVTDTVDNTVGNVTDTAGGVTDAIDNATGNGGNGGNGGGGGSVTDPVTGAVRDVTGGLRGSLDDLTPGMLDELIEGAAAKGLSPAAAEGWIEGKKILGSSSSEGSAGVLSSLSSMVEDLAGDIASASSTSTSSSFYDAESASGPRESFFDSAGRAATNAAKALAFPLALALLVVAFLAVQGRIGRKDPKLVLAPVDPIHESLTFE